MKEEGKVMLFFSPPFKYILFVSVEVATIYIELFFFFFFFGNFVISYTFIYKG